jgi:hypothetical protein
MPINNALTPQGQNALGAAFGYYPQLRRNRRSQDPQAALDMPVQFLRGRLASTLGMPSDVLNTLQSPLPMEVYGDVDYSAAQQVPYGTQDLLQQLPLAPTGPAQQAAANLGSVVPMTPMEALQAARLARQAALAGGQAVASTGRALAPVAGDMLTNYMVKRNMILPLDVYHGTPHTLPPTPRNPLGEFDASKIGTGEGAQAYGHGIYTAEAKDVGAEYARNLANRDAANQGRLNAHANAQRLAAVAGDPAYAADDIKFVLSNEPDHPQKQLLSETLRQLESGDYKKPLVNKGNLYKIDLPDEMIAKMLDWDKPLSQQSESVKKALSVDKRAKDSLYQNAAEYYRALTSQYAQNAPLHYSVEQAENSAQQFASQKLREMGIPGIKYLDQGSRGEGQGTRNFVTFPGEEKKMTILKRN